MSLSDPLEPRVAAPLAGIRRMGQVASAAAGHTWIEGFFRFGYIVRGVIYLIPGVLALELALGTHGATITQTDAIEMIGHQFLGRILLLVVAVGLASYSLWGVNRAVLDPLHQGHSPRGLARRFGYAMSALAHAGLLAATLRYLSIALPLTASHQDWSTELLAKPFGAWLVGIIGVCWIAGSGIGEIARGWQGRFKQDLAFDRMSSFERRWAVPLGRFGTVARGGVFTIVGMLMVAAALHVAPHRQGGMDGALLELARQPFGRLLLGAAALGLIAFGAYSMMCARWMRMHANPHEQRSRRFSSHPS
jgi:uncharacterized protein DUF1206